MIFPEVSLETWQKKYPGLEPQPGECECGTKGMTTIPWYSKEWVGLAMPECKKCGDEVPAFTCKARSPELQAEMNRLIPSSKGQKS